MYGKTDGASRLIGVNDDGWRGTPSTAPGRKAMVETVAAMDAYSVRGGSNFIIIILCLSFLNPNVGFGFLEFF